jgi:phosphoglucosamine mutase
LNKTAFEELGANVVLINSNSDYGTGINRDCGSTHLDSLQKLVLENKLDFGIAFDGDGDRCLLVDNKGEIVDGDQIIAILLNYLELKTAVVTVMANQGLINWAKENDISLEITSVGDSNVATAMREKNIELGGEQSGHIILPGEATGDGMLTALLICEVVSSTKQTLSELAGIIKKLPQIMINMNATSKQKESLRNNDSVKKLLLEYNEKMSTVSGRLLVRPSGTENLIRITMWGNDDKEIKVLANELKNKLEELL